MLASTRCSLPHGTWRGNVHHRDVVVRALDGADQLAIAELSDSLPQAAWVTALLARCVQTVGTIVDESTEEIVRHLAVGDREALLLQIRRLTFGDRMECVLDCPTCGEPLESVLSAERLLVPPYAHPLEWYDVSAVAEDDVLHRARVRVPTGADQEAVAALATSDAPGAAAALLSRCTREIRRDVSPLKEDDRVPACLVERIDALLPSLDPQSELELELACAACGHEFSTLFDTASYLQRELDALGRDLYREVHVLASQYHWSEAEILALSPAKRGRYLDLVAESAAGAVT